MKIRYTFHALERMKQRAIDKELVEKSLENHDKISSMEKDVYRCIKKIDGRILVVIYSILTILTITAFISTKNTQVSRMSCSNCSNFFILTE